MSFTDLLLAINSGNNARLQAAEAQLNRFKTENFDNYMLSLCRELVVGADPVARQMAGVLLKLELDSKDPLVAEQHALRWRALDPSVKGQIKEGLFSTLATEDPKAGHVAAQLIGKIGAIEIPAGEWPGLIDALLPNMTTANEVLKRATVQTLGYVCEAVPMDVFSPDEVAATLTAIMAGLAPEEPSMDVRHASTKALGHALPLLASAMANLDERNYVMTAICSATQSEDTRVRRAALEVLIKIISAHYSVMGEYMSAIFSVAFAAVRGDPEPSALQAVEVFSTVCEEEMYLAAMAAEAAKRHQAPAEHSYNFIKNDLGIICQMLLETMCRQLDHQEEGAWTLSMAAGTSLDLVAKTVGDEVLGHTVDFILTNVFVQDNWRAREAAVFAFGSILSGVSTGAVSELIHSGIPLFAQLMNDAHELVGESASWTLARICKLHHGAILPEHFEALLYSLNMGLELNERVAANCAWAIGNLATSLGAGAEETSALAPYYADLLRTLLAVAAKPDSGSGSNVRTSCYLAVSSLVRNAPLDCSTHVFTVFQVITQRLEESLSMDGSTATDVEKRSEFQAVLCSVLRDITQKVQEEMAPFVDSLMNLYMGVFMCRPDTVHEEALLAVGALATAVDDAIAPSLTTFFPVLLYGLRNFAESNVCTIALGVVGDLARALDEGFCAHLEETMTALFEDLAAPTLPPAVKASILAVFGDIALACGEAFADYFSACIPVLMEAAAVVVDTGIEEHVDYLNDLRENTCEGFTGIIQGLRDTHAALLLPYAAQLYDFVATIYADTTRSEAVTRGAVSILCDLSVALMATHREVVAQYLASDWARAIVHELDQSDDPDTMDVAKFARKTMKKFGL